MDYTLSSPNRVSYKQRLHVLFPLDPCHNPVRLAGQERVHLYFTGEEAEAQSWHGMFRVAGSTQELEPRFLFGNLMPALPCCLAPRWNRMKSWAPAGQIQLCSGCKPFSVFNIIHAPVSRAALTLW